MLMHNISLYQITVEFLKALTFSLFFYEVPGYVWKFLLEQTLSQQLNLSSDFHCIDVSKLYSSYKLNIVYV